MLHSNYTTKHTFEGELNETFFLTNFSILKIGEFIYFY
ncbi:hypothetical protein HMPREF9413_1099 [Paenibacillus sp. HGF7]|nr:hypothetical protein HMPREF9413_1099 [Paenibacillus sp. HGF7]